jgi:hypothetical protein
MLTIPASRPASTTGRCRMTQIRTTGQIVITGREYEAGLFTACVQQVAADQRRQGAAVGDVATTLMSVEGAHGHN